MSFRFICPFCNQSLDCDDELDNVLCNCPSCGNEIVCTKMKTNGIKIVKNTPEIIKTVDEDKNAKQQIIINNYNNGNPIQNTNVCVTKPLCNRWAWIFLGLFLHPLGIHMFYAGYNKIGVAHIIASIFFVSLGPVGIILSWIVQFIWFIVELICINKDAYNRPFI